jgi:hypothetical protein
MRKILFLTAFAAVLLFSVAQAFAVTLGFNWIQEPNDGPTQFADGAIGEAQFSVDITDPGGGQVLFTFKNKEGGAQSTISEIYFDDGALLGISSIVNNSPNINFVGGSANPGNLPSGNNLTPPFVATEGFVADAEIVQGGIKPGVDPGESVGIYFDLKPTMTYTNVLAALALPLPHVYESSNPSGQDNWLRIGIHVTNYASGGSEGFVNNPVPLPGAVLLLGAGMARLVAYARRRQD